MLSRLGSFLSNKSISLTFRDVDKSTEAAFRVEMARLKKVQQESQPSSSKNPPVDEVDDESSSSSDSSSSSSSPSTDDEVWKCLSFIFFFNFSHLMDLSYKNLAQTQV